MALSILQSKEKLQVGYFPKTSHFNPFMPRNCVNECPLDIMIFNKEYSQFILESKFFGSVLINIPFVKSMNKMLYFGQIDITNMVMPLWCSAVVMLFI